LPGERAEQLEPTPGRHDVDDGRLLEKDAARYVETARQPDVAKRFARRRSRPDRLLIRFSQSRRLQQRRPRHVAPPDHALRPVGDVYTQIETFCNSLIVGSDPPRQTVAVTAVSPRAPPDRE
jgi:hypothetical protein